MMIQELDSFVIVDKDFCFVINLATSVKSKVKGKGFFGPLLNSILKFTVHSFFREHSGELLADLSKVDMVGNGQSYESHITLEDEFFIYDISFQAKSIVLGIEPTGVNMEKVLEKTVANFFHKNKPALLDEFRENTYRHMGNLQKRIKKMSTNIAS
jgi:hypothetical protein